MYALRIAAALLVVSVANMAFGQSRLPDMPRYDRYEKLRRQIAGSIKRPNVNPRWSSDGKLLGYNREGKDWTLEISTGKESEGWNQNAEGTGNNRRNQRRNPDRGRQFDTVFSADGSMKAMHKGRNVYLSKADGSGEVAVTTEGSEADRTKYGIASWVYGEELGVREAMWFSPDGKKLAYYFFDEKEVPDYYLALKQSEFQAQLDVEAYPKAGKPNPKVELYVYDIESKAKTKIDVTFSNAETGHYVYEVRWSPDGKELLFNRTNRMQNVMQFCAANPSTGACRVVVEERSPNSWTENSPTITWLEKSKGQFIWLSERNGFRNFYLGSITGSPLKPITQHTFDVGNVIRVDEEKGMLYYTARDGDNPYKMQLHRIGMDGKGDRRLTDPSLHHSIQLSPDGKFFVDTAESMEIPPSATLRDETGKAVKELARSDISEFESLGLKRAERIKFKAADGVTDLYGYLMKPSDFDPSKKYPLLVSMYAGPESGSGSETFLTPNPITEMGFLVAWFDGRGTSGRGKAFKDAVYKKLGIVEIDDQAAGVKYLRQRAYVDGSNVGAYGTSYGGYSSLMCLLRHPDVFQAAVSSSSVTDWRHYDSIYTERYMGLPTAEDNLSGYEEGSAMKYARDLKGRLMLYYGTADNNVHPSNTLMIAKALQGAGKSFDMMAGPDLGHTGINSNRMWEFFIDYLILSNHKDSLALTWGRYKRSMAARR